MLTDAEKVLVLKTVDIFESVPEEYLVDIASVIELETYHAGEAIIQQDDIGAALYMIVSGTARVLRDGREIALIGEREVFGELSALDPEPRSATVEADGEIEVFSLDNSRLAEMIRAYPAVSRGIIRMLVRRIRNTTVRRG